MNKRDLKALKGSIKKWWSILNRDVGENGTVDCPLCTIYNNTGGSSYRECRGCPVEQRVDKEFCVGTPYERWAKLWGSPDGAYMRKSISNSPTIAFKKKAIKHAEGEFEFLLSLLPEGEVWQSPDGYDYWYEK